QRHQVSGSSRVIVVRESAPGEKFEGWLLDQSAGGLGLSVAEQLEPGTLLLIRQAGVADDAPWGRVEVRYCRLHRGRWRLGCQYAETPGLSASQSHGRL